MLITSILPINLVNFPPPTSKVQWLSIDVYSLLYFGRPVVGEQDQQLLDKDEASQLSKS